MAEQLTKIQKWSAKRKINKWKKDLEKTLKNIKEKNDQKRKQQLKQKMINAIMDMNQEFDIQDEKLNEKGEIQLDKKGNPILIPITKEILTTKPLNELINLFQEIIEETEKRM